MKVLYLISLLNERTGFHVCLFSTDIHAYCWTFAVSDVRKPLCCDKKRNIRIQVLYENIFPEENGYKHETL